ncbi:MAG: hypothetical protein GX456_13815 [Verrucomicrobia bacterium]|nr:hypothetical protein [Verrucomicrobiota bacterium]
MLKGDTPHSDPTTCLSPYDHTTFALATDPNGFSCAAADALGVGRREAFGVRQLAAALFLCTNNLPGTRSALRTKQRACPRIAYSPSAR